MTGPRSSTSALPQDTDDDQKTTLTLAARGPRLLACGHLPVLRRPAPAPRSWCSTAPRSCNSPRSGQDIATPDAGLCQPGQERPAAQGKALQTEGRNLQQQVAILAPDVKARRGWTPSRPRNEALQGAAQRKDEQLKAGVRQARADHGRQARTDPAAAGEGTRRQPGAGQAGGGVRQQPTASTSPATPSTG